MQQHSNIALTKKQAMKEVASVQIKVVEALIKKFQGCESESIWRKKIKLNLN